MKLTHLAAFLLLAACSSGNNSMMPGPSPSPSPGPASATQIFPSDNAWNQDISGADVDPNSDAYINSIGANDGVHQDFSSVAGGNYGIPYVVVPGTQKMVPVEFVDYPEESDPGPYPIPDDAPIEQGGDAHVIVVDYDNGMLYELYQGARQSGKWSAANGAKFNIKANPSRPAGWTSADAAGLSIFAGLARYDEVKAGEIKHALRFTVSKSAKFYVPPASHAAGSTSDQNVPPMGMRVRLKASFDISTFGPQAQVILKALKKYGMIVADNGSDWFISGAPHADWDDDDIGELNKVKGHDFEVVKMGTKTAYP